VNASDPGHTGALYDDPGADYYTRRDPDGARRNAVNQLQRLGYQSHPDPRPLPQHEAAPTKGIFASEVVFSLCPQRGSNPCCRLESAKFGISRHLPRFLVIG
jgi:hypothetical protein